MECPNCGRQLGAHSQRCASCGKAVPPGQHLLEEAGLLADEAAAGAKTAVSPPPVTPRFTCRTAGLGDRLVAAMLDGIVLLGGAAIIAAWTFTRWGVSSGDGGLRLTLASLLIAGLLCSALTFLYFWLGEAAFGATLGKALVGIRVLRMGTHGRLAASAIRNGLRFVDGIGFYLVGAMVAACSRRSQRLGDLIAGTVVVENPFSVSIKVLSVLLWTAALVGAVWGLPRVSAAEMPTQPPRYFARTVGEIGYTANSAYLSTDRWRVELSFMATPTVEKLATAQ